jgi:hypothetical protein
MLAAGPRFCGLTKDEHGKLLAGLASAAKFLEGMAWQEEKILALLEFAKKPE